MIHIIAKEARDKSYNEWSTGRTKSRMTSATSASLFASKRYLWNWRPYRCSKPSTLVFASQLCGSASCWHCHGKLHAQSVRTRAGRWQSFRALLPLRSGGYLDRVLAFWRQGSFPQSHLATYLQYSAHFRHFMYVQLQLEHSNWDATFPSLLVETDLAVMNPSQYEPFSFTYSR